MLEKIMSKYRQDSNMYKNIIGTSFIKCISLILGIITIRAYNHYFCNNQEIVGVWLTAVSILSWVVNFDLGLGNGLRNVLVKHISAGDTKAQKVCISSAYFLLSGLSLIIAIVFCVIIRFVNWNNILNISSDIIPNESLVFGIQIAFIGLILQFILKLVISILYALKQTSIGSLPIVLANALIFAFASIFSNSSPQKSFIMISLAYAISMVAPLIITTIIVFSTIMKNAKPSRRCFDKEVGKSILLLGSQFFSIQILLLIINSTNEIIITQISGTAAVVQYSMYFRVFSAIIALYSVIINPVWSSVSDSYYRQDLNGILTRKKTIRIISFVFVAGSFVLASMLRLVFAVFYSSEAIDVKPSYAIIFAIFTSIMVLVNSTSCIENGINDLKPQIIGNFTAALIKIPLCVLITNVLDDWIFVVIVNIIIMTISYCIQQYGLNRKLKTIKDSWKQED